MEEERKNNKSFISKGKKEDVYHVLYKLPYGDSPYVRAKHAQLVEKDPEAAIVLFWKAINAGDKVDSALKDMAVVMKQLDRSEEAIEAISSFRGLCSKQSQESLDNVLIDLYKKCGKIDEQIDLLKQKLKLIYQGKAFNGKLTKTARSHGKKFQVSIKQETSRLLVRDLDFSIKVIGCEITRENDGLAMSSRNVYLSPEEREKALSINKSLSKAKSAAEDGQVQCEKLRSLVIECITEAGGTIDYAEIVDQHSLEKVEFIKGPVVFCVAALFGKVRLIDNMEINL